MIVISSRGKRVNTDQFELIKQVQLERLRSENTSALSPWTNFKLGLP